MSYGKIGEGIFFCSQKISKLRFLFGSMIITFAFTIILFPLEIIFFELHDSSLKNFFP